jgi:transcriptional regulator with XRE-family HTH domain
MQVDVVGDIALPVPKGIKNPLHERLASRLVEARLAADLSQDQLAERSGVSNAAISRIECGLSRPAVDTVERLAAALAVDACWLAFGWDGAKPFAQRIRRLIPVDPSPTPESVPLAFEESYRGISARLTEARLLRRLSMRGLAELAKVSVQTVSKTEGGLTVPIVSNLEALAVGLGVSPCWLAFGVGQIPRLEGTADAPSDSHHLDRGALGLKD